MIKATHNGFTVEVDYDDEADNPREPIGTMVCWHRRLHLGDEHTFDTPTDFEETEKPKAYVCLPLYLYDHSILALSTQSFVGRALHAEWDSGQVGYIYILPEDVYKRTGYEPTESNKATVEEILNGEVDLYSNYLQGNVYCFSITDSEGDFVVGGNGYVADSAENALQEMKECCWEHEKLFEKLQKQTQSQM